MFEHKAKSRFLKVFTVVFIVSVAIGAIIYYLTTVDITKKGMSNQLSNLKQRIQAPQPTAAPQSTQAPTSVQPGAGIFTGIPVAQSVAKSATQGVVGIMVERISAGKLFDSNDGSQVGMGSGVIVSSDGFILTNHHVAGGKSKRIVVSLADSRNVDGETVWSDPVLDLAVVKVNLSGLPALTLGDARSLGQKYFLTHIDT